MKIGDRIKLVKMENDPCPIEPGSEGSVTEINATPWDGQTQVVVKWDSGRTLMLILPEDEIIVISC